MTKYFGYSFDSELESKDDAATVNWGNDWQMPSRAQFEELINGNYTTIIMTTQNEIKGMLITSKSNNNSIFLPAAGSKSVDEKVHEEVGSICYWSRSISTDAFYRACLLHDYRTAYSPNVLWGISEFGSRYSGLSVLPVRKQ